MRVLSDLEGEEGGEEEDELVLPVRLGGVCWSVLSVFCPSLPPDRSVTLLPLFLSLALRTFGEGDFLLLMGFGICSERFFV